MGAGACPRTDKHTKQEFKFRSRPGSRMLSQLLRQQKGPCSCCFFTRHTGRGASASRATARAGGEHAAQRPAHCLQKKSAFVPGQLLPQLPRPPLSELGLPGAARAAPFAESSYTGGDREPTSGQFPKVILHGVIGPLSLQDFSFLWCRLLSWVLDSAVLKLRDLWGWVHLTDRDLDPNLRAPGNHGESKRCLAGFSGGAEESPGWHRSLKQPPAQPPLSSPACWVRRMPGDAGTQQAEDGLQGSPAGGMSPTVLVTPELEDGQGKRQIISTSSQQGKLRQQEGLFLGFSWNFVD